MLRNVNFASFFRMYSLWRRSLCWFFCTFCDGELFVRVTSFSQFDEFLTTFLKCWHLPEICSNRQIITTTLVCWVTRDRIFIMKTIIVTPRDLLTTPSCPITSVTVCRLRVARAIDRRFRRHSCIRFWWGRGTKTIACTWTAQWNPRVTMTIPVVTHGIHIIPPTLILTTSISGKVFFRGVIWGGGRVRNC